MRKSGLFLVVLALVSAAHAAPVLKNSSFDQKLALWETEEGKLAADPTDAKNTALRLELDGGTFGLSQEITWPAEKKELTLSFRARAEQATPESPIQLRVRFYDAAGNSSVLSTRITTSGKWLVIKIPIKKPDFKVVSFMLESNRGEGALWLDDVKLE